MKPVAIFRHAAVEGPGYLADFLDRHAIPWQLIRVDAGDSVPTTPEAFSGLAFMGGPMSVNDDLPWLAREFSLIREAHAQDIPLLGHCLGGQLISRALGAVVSRNPLKEIGWGEVTCPTMPRHVRGSAISDNSIHFIGMARPLRCHRARRICLPAHTVRIRDMPWASIWHCNAMSR